MYKQVIAIRKDLGLGLGKAVAQAAHASLKAYQLASPRVRKEWELEGAKKIVVAVNSAKELFSLHSMAKRLDLPTALVKDAGLTQVKPGTSTAVAIGPCSEADADKLTGGLKLL